VGAVVTGGMTMLRPPCRCAIQSYDGQSSVLYQIIACKAVAPWTPAVLCSCRASRGCTFPFPRRTGTRPTWLNSAFQRYGLEAFLAFLLGVMGPGQLPLEQGHLRFIRTSLRSGTMPTMMPCSPASGPVPCWPLRWPCCHHLVMNHCQSRSLGHAGVGSSLSAFSVALRLEQS
jgi:hypothetical protein